jgi:hypothetical protein
MGSNLEKESQVIKAFAVSLPHNHLGLNHSCRRSPVMRKALLISLSLFLALVGWGAVCADDGFYVIPAMRGNYAPVPKTGQTTSYVPRDDGDLEMGVPWPTPRLIDNGNGTVTDKLTGLVWTKNANVFGQTTWEESMLDASALQAGYGGLTDGSQAGDWRLPNRNELESLLDCGKHMPALPAGHPFTNVRQEYWTSSTYAQGEGYAWMVDLFFGRVSNLDKEEYCFMWCVRGGK